MSISRARVTSAGRRGIGLVRPRVARALVADAVPRDASDHEHLDAVMAWLALAQDVTGVGGVAARYDLATGWDQPYPETTGYIVGTALHHADVVADTTWTARATRMGEWLLELQAPDGWIAGGLARAAGTGRPEVFNTGQVLFGWLALHQVTGRDDFARAAARAARWLVEVQSPDGAWVTASLHDVPHAYYTRVTWALAKAGAVLDDADATAAARRSIAWTCAQQRDDGWIEHMSFTPGSPALTHTIAYTIEGLLECALVLDDARAWGAALVATRALAARARELGIGDGRGRRLPATFGPGFAPADVSYDCVTGSAQLALCARRLQAFDPAAGDLADFAEALWVSVARAHPLSGPHGVRGGVPGSQPIWGAYASFKYLNWAAKFVADLLLDRVAGGLPRDRHG